MSEIIYENVTIENLSRVSAAGAKWGMPRSASWLRRVLYDPTVNEFTADKVRGHMAVDKGTGEVVAMLCYYYIPMYFMQTRILANSGCILGADKKFGEEIFCINDKNRAGTANSLIYFGNAAATATSEKISRFMQKASPPSLGGDYFYVKSASLSLYSEMVLRRILHGQGLLSRFVFKVANVFTEFMLCPLQMLRSQFYRAANVVHGYKLVYSSHIDEHVFGEFWRKYLEHNDGLVSSREPNRLKWLFEDSLKAGKVILIIAQKGCEMVGYVLVRKRVKDLIPTYEIVDVCALQNDAQCLRALVRGACNKVKTLGGKKIVYYCFMHNVKKWFTGIRRKQDHSSFLYRIDNPAIVKSLDRGEGWFWGPFDGERCMGYGGNIDL